MNRKTSNLRIDSIVPMPSPQTLLGELPLGDAQAASIARTRQTLADIIHGHDERLLVVVGPCSIHDPVSALDYAQRLLAVREQYADALEIVMRVYFEKPRTIVGWKGLINDPDMNGSFDIGQGLRKARSLLVSLAELGMPVACEFLDAATGQYYADTVSWGAIGARTTESQVHREIASGLSCPVGFKNATHGDIGIAVDAMQAAGHAHAFLSPTSEGKIALFRTRGNPDTHLILRGGTVPNYDSEAVAVAWAEQGRRGLKQRIMIDCSHANSAKDYRRQPVVVDDVAQRLGQERHMLAGLMIESHITEGKQVAVAGEPLVYGQSVTDGCIGWSQTEAVLSDLHRHMAVFL